MSVLLWKISKVAVIDIVSYVDDVKVLANSEAVLAYVWGLAVSFAKDFCLDLALQKCYLWGTHPTRLSQLAQEWGVGYRTEFDILGVHWVSDPSKPSKYEKDCSRLDMAKERMRIMAYLPMKTTAKVSALTNGCLSLVTYAPIPAISKALKQRAAIRLALGQSSGSPEILFSILSRTSSDPAYWLLSMAKFWHVWANSEYASYLDMIHKNNQHNRMAAFRNFCLSLGWWTTSELVRFHDSAFFVLEI